MGYTDRIEGELQGFAFQAEDGGYAVGRLKPDSGADITIVGPIGHLPIGSPPSCRVLRTLRERAPRLPSRLLLAFLPVVCFALRLRAWGWSPPHCVVSLVRYVVRWKRGPVLAVLALSPRTARL